MTAETQRSGAPEDVTALRELVAKVPQGEYTREDGAFAYVMMPDGDALMLEPEDKTRADYICAALNALPGLLDRLEALERALRDVMALYDWDDPLAAFEALASAFYDETGMMAPGKSVPLEWGGRWTDEKRRDAYDAWIKERGKSARARARALLASPTSHRSASGGAQSHGEAVP